MTRILSLLTASRYYSLQYNCTCPFVHSYLVPFRFFGGNGNRNHCAILNSENFFLYVPYCITYPAYIERVKFMHHAATVQFSVCVYTVQVRQVFCCHDVALPSQNVEHVRNYCRDVVS